MRRGSDYAFVRWNCTPTVSFILSLLRCDPLRLKWRHVYFGFICYLCEFIVIWYLGFHIQTNLPTTNTTTTQQPHTVQSLFDFSNSNIKRMLTLPVENNLRKSTQMSHLYLFIFKHKKYKPHNRSLFSPYECCALEVWPWPATIISHFLGM